MVVEIAVDTPVVEAEGFVDIAAVVDTPVVTEAPDTLAVADVPDTPAAAEAVEVADTPAEVEAAVQVADIPDFVELQDAQLRPPAVQVAQTVGYLYFLLVLIRNLLAQGCQQLPEQQHRTFHKICFPAIRRNGNYDKTYHIPLF